MRRLISTIMLALTGAIPVSIMSCAPGACFEETDADIKASFYSYSTKTIEAPDSITLYGINNDSIKIYNNTTDVQPALFPLDASTNNCTFVISINNITDTVKVVYSSYPHFISKECGYSFYHNLDSLIYTTHGIDSVYRTNNNITTANEENIRIFY